MVVCGGVSRIFAELLLPSLMFLLSLLSLGPPSTCPRVSHITAAAAPSAATAAVDVACFISQAVFSSVGGAEELRTDAPPSVATGPGGMDEVDHHGNTPLLLALQLGRLECATVSRVLESWSLQERGQERGWGGVTRLAAS